MSLWVSVLGNFTNERWSCPNSPFKNTVELYLRAVAPACQSCGLWDLLYSLPLKVLALEAARAFNKHLYPPEDREVEQNGEVAAADIIQLKKDNRDLEQQISEKNKVTEIQWKWLFPIWLMWLVFLIQQPTVCQWGPSGLQKSMILQVICDPRY